MTDSPRALGRFAVPLILAGLVPLSASLRAQPVPAALAPAAAGSDAGASVQPEEIVKLDAFTVSTTIGTYHEETSAMATKIPTDLKDLAESLQVINANAIADRNAQTLPDIFNYIVGANQSQNAINGFSFRGLPNTGTFTQNIEFDGLQGATLKKGASSSANVEEMEFLKGPNSVLYGEMNPGGLLNIVTKSPLETRQGVLRVSVGDYFGGYSNGDNTVTDDMIDVTGPIDRGHHWLYRLVVDAASNPQSRPLDYDRSISIYPSLTYKWNQDTYFTVKVESSQDKRRQDDGLIPIFTNKTAYGENALWYTAPYNTVYQDPTDVGRDRGDSLSTVFHTEVAGWTIQTQTRATWHTDLTHELTVNNNGVYSPKATFATPTTVINRQYNLQINGHRYDFADARAYRVFGPEMFQDTFLVGLAGGQEFSNNSRYAFGPTVTPSITLINPILGQSPYPANGTGLQSSRNDLSSFGEYLMEQLRLWRRFHLSVGYRHDQQIIHGIDAYNPVKTPYGHSKVTSNTVQAGLVYDLTDALSVYADESQSIFPNAVTSVNAQGQSVFPPQTGQQYEGGLKIETPDHNFYTTFAAYYIDRANVLVATGTTVPVTGQGIFRLDGAQHSEGLEWESQWQPKPFLQMQAGVALGKAFVAASAQNPQTIGSDLIGAPRASGSFWGRYNVPNGFFKGLGIGTGVIYVGKSWAGDPTTTVYYTMPGWTRVDTALYYNWNRYSFALTCKNLLDRRYIASAQSAITLNPGEVRTVILQATTRF